MMKLPIGLVIEGNSTASTLLRLSAVASELGPIKSSTLQVARRVSNFLKGGYGVENYSGLSSARTILIRAPDAALDRIISEICDADLVWHKHAFVLCESWTRIETLDRLRDQGAGTASVVELPTRHEKVFGIEGDVVVVRQLRRMIDRTEARIIEIRPGTKHLLFAATVLCTTIPIPLLLMAQQQLRECGVSGNQLSTLIEGLTTEMLSGFLKGARMTWGGALADCLLPSEGGYWDDLEKTHPEHATVLKKLIELGQAQMAPKMSRVTGA